MYDLILAYNLCISFAFDVINKYLIIHKVVRKFVDDYVNNLTPDQLREIVSEQSHIDFENIRQDTGIDSVFEEMASWDSELWVQIAIDFDIPEEAE